MIDIQGWVIDHQFGTTFDGFDEVLPKVFGCGGDCQMS